MYLTDKIYTNPVFVLHGQSDGWAVLFNTETYKSIALNPVGVFIWNHLNGIHSIHDIMHELHNKYEGVRESEEPSVLEFIELLIAEGCAGYDDFKQSPAV
jgi:hypothetical protein